MNSLSSYFAAGISSMLSFMPLAKKDLPENLKKRKTLNNAISNSNIELDDIDLIIVDNNELSKKINEKLRKNTGIFIKNTVDNNGVQITTVKATTLESSNKLRNFLSNLIVGAGAVSGAFGAVSDSVSGVVSGAFGAVSDSVSGAVSDSVSGASQVLEGIFINKKNVDNHGYFNFNSVNTIIDNPIFSEENKPSDSVQTIPFVNNITHDTIINIETSSKKKYIGIPKILNNADRYANDNDENILLNQLIEWNLNRLIDWNVINKIDITEDLLNKDDITGYDENLYDYYEINIDKCINEHINQHINLLKEEIEASFRILSKNNTLYIYEIEPEQATGVSISSVSTFINNITGPTKNVLSKFVGKITGESEKKKGKEQKIDESIIETNNEAPKCDNKNTKSKRFNGTRKKNTTNDDENSVEIQGETPSTFQRLAKMAESLTNTSNTRKNKKAVVAPTRISSRNRQHIEK